MIHISHRGNIFGRVKESENDPIYIQQALDKGFDVEVDVWHIDNQFWLGHDNPQYKVTEGFLEQHNLWCHAKNIDALYVMNTNYHIHCFWHQEDDVTLTSRGYLWTYPGKQLTSNSIAVLPDGKVPDNIVGICSDFIGNFRVLL
jgi:hypothetical protein